MFGRVSNWKIIDYFNKLNKKVKIESTWPKIYLKIYENVINSAKNFWIKGLIYTVSIRFNHQTIKMLLISILNLLL